MLDPATWLARAQQIPRGKTIRTSHVCGSGTCMTLENTTEGFRAYCFRCSDTGFVQHPNETFEEKVQRLRVYETHDAKLQETIELPQPAIYDTKEWPLDAKVWLYKAGLSNVDIKRLGAYYHGQTDRVVLPVFDVKGNVIYWQARAVQAGRVPKYINPRVDKSRLTATYGTTDSVRIVLTEDILSAYRVGRVCQSKALLGTRLSDYVLNDLILENKEVIIWLDPDEPGQKAARKITQQLNVHGVTSRSIVSAVDPKLLTNKEIQKWIN